MKPANRRQQAVDLSIAIPSWNTRELLDQCLESVHKNSDGLLREIIVVDNDSGDGSADMVAAKYPRVRLIRNRVNVGFAGACNLAYRRSTGRYFMLLNSDTIVLDDALKAMVRFMDQHRDAGAAGCKLLNCDGSLQRSCSCFPGLLTELFDAMYLSKLFPRSRVFACYPMSFWNFDHTREVDFAGGSCLIVRREAVSEVGLLDEEYFMYTEEADWCYRMWDHGWAVYFYPGAQVTHLGGESAREFGNGIHLNLYTSRNRFILKHRGRAAASVHRLIVALGASIRLPAFGIRRVMGADMSDAISLQRSLLRWALLGTQPANRPVHHGGAPCEWA